MPAPKASSSGSSRSSSARKRRASNAAPARDGSPAKAGDRLSGLAEQLANSIIKPLGVVMLTRERIQETLDDAAARGRLTRADANALGTELFNRGRQQTETLLGEVERLLGRGRAQIESATKRARDPVERLVRTADRARRGTSSAGASLPISDYDDLTARQVEDRLGGLRPAQLRQVREYERRHANRKSVLAAIDRALG